MPENLSRQILKEHLVDGELKPGEPIGLRIDQTLLQDATGTMACMQYEQPAVPRVKVDRAVQYVEHNVIQLDNKNPDDHRMLQAMARKFGIDYSRPGNGICHYVHIERYAKPGGILVGAHSHTTTSGALGMIAIGAGGLDVAVAMAGYPYEIACPEGVGGGAGGATRARSRARRSWRCGSRASSTGPGCRRRTSSSSCCASCRPAAAR